MEKVVEHWWSPRVFREVTMSRWGHFGPPLLLFPTASGDALEVEREGLLDALAPLVEAGGVKVYSVDSVAGRDIAEREGSPRDRIRLLDQYHRAIEHEVVAAIHADCRGPQEIVTAGVSLGAFTAVAMVCRYPHLFRAALGMSGSYDLEAFVGESSEELYLASPLHFLPGLEGPTLETLRRRQVLLAAGTGRWEDIAESWRLAVLLGDKGVPNRVDDWGPHHHHDWPTWQQMLPTYLPQLLTSP